MNRHHAEPVRVLPTRCPECGLPSDVTEQCRVDHRVALLPAGLAWGFCGTCGESTCDEMRRICAEEAERAKEAE